MKNSHLGDLAFSKKSFKGTAKTFLGLRASKFMGLTESSRFFKVSEALLNLLQGEPEPCFLLSHVLEFVERVEKEKILPHYTFNHFERWLNQESGLSSADNYRIRGKIAGKWIERGDYQAFFPVGMGKVYDGPHFVTAHKSPDLDTTVASFWGWLDAFAARVGNGLHLWNLPGGPPQSQIEIDWMFRDVFGEAVFSHLPKTRTSLHLTAFELLSASEMIQMPLSGSIAEVDHDRDHQAVVLVDKAGFYLGDWRGVDFEEVQQVILLLSSTLRWFQNHLHLHLMKLFAKERLSFADVKPALAKLFHLALKTSEPVQEFSAKQKKHVEDFLVKALQMEKGFSCTFEELGVHLAKKSNAAFEGVDSMVSSMKNLFDSKGHLVEERPRLFLYLEKVVNSLHEALFQIRKRLEGLDVALAAKTAVFGHPPTSVNIQSDLEEIKRKFDAYSFLTVTASDGDQFYPVGVVQVSTLRKNFLGSVSLRDFCNREEMGIPPYLDVISVIDHHKTSLSTGVPPFAILADAQSCNTLVARQAFLINDRYSLRGQTLQSINKQLTSTPSTSLMQKLLQRRLAAERQHSFYVHPERESIEYLHFLYAIFDDTDLLTKVTPIDVETVASLLNRLKTLQTGKESEVISLSDLPRDEKFAKKAAARILQHEETYSLYRQIYLYREKEVEKNLELAIQGVPSNLFADTKEQNGCCRIGQTKMFASNVPLFVKKGDALKRLWLGKAEKVHKEHPDIDLHIHMLSTIVSAEEVYKGKPAKYTHHDELWLWIPPTEMAIERLKSFLSRFQASPGLQGGPLELEFLGSNSKELSLICSESFLPIPHKFAKKDLNMLVLRFAPGALNSRKAMISPYLPTVE
jgi:hypothetical protein